MRLTVRRISDKIGISKMDGFRRGEAVLWVWASHSPNMPCFMSLFVGIILALRDLALFRISGNRSTVLFCVNPAKIAPFKTNGEFIDRDNFHSIPHRLQTGRFIAVKHAHFIYGLNFQQAGSIIVNDCIAPCGFFRRPACAEGSFCLFLRWANIIHMNTSLIEMRLTVRRISRWISQ